MATFLVEDGTGYSNTNSYLEIVDADEIISNYGNSALWLAATDDAKETALRQATRYLDLHYLWSGYKVAQDQALQWPRYEMYDEDGWLVDYTVIPNRLKEACAYLAIKVIDGNTLLEDFVNNSKVKRTKDVIGPITEEREYIVGESPDTTYQVVDKLVYSFVYGDDSGVVDLERA